MKLHEINFISILVTLKIFHCGHWSINSNLELFNLLQDRLTIGGGNSVFESPCFIDTLSVIKRLKIMDIKFTIIM